MTRQFHARVRRAQKPKLRDPRPHTLSFKCFRLVPIDGFIELCDPRNAMRVLVFER
jgi:hypothetical protein